MLCCFFDMREEEAKLLVRLEASIIVENISFFVLVLVWMSALVEIARR